MSYIAMLHVHISTLDWSRVGVYHSLPINVLTVPLLAEQRAVTETSYAQSIAVSSALSRIQKSTVRKCPHPMVSTPAQTAA